ncbi:MAG: anti-sigma factor domain-containing protein [Gemmatimonadota bacterium]
MTTTPMHDDRFAELTIEHLLGTLSPEATGAFEAELARRGAAGRHAVRRLEETLGALALAAEPVEPPARLRDRVLAAVGGEAEREAVASVPVERVARRRRVWQWDTLAAAALLGGLIPGISHLALHHEHERLQADYAAVRSRLAITDSSAIELAAELAALRAVTDAARADLALVAEPGSTVHSLIGSGSAAVAAARIFIDPFTGRAILFATGLPILPPGKVYELWAIRGEKPVPAGIFTPGDDGRARFEITDTASLDGVTTLAVTVETAPGAPAPTGERVLVPPTS